MLVLNSVVEDAKFGRAQLDCQTFTDTMLLPDLTADDGWSIVLQYLVFVHTGNVSQWNNVPTHLKINHIVEVTPLVWLHGLSLHNLYSTS